MGTPLKVLFVEDSEVDAELTLVELERGGFEPSSDQVQTLEEMRSALGDQQWDVVICDYKMPRFTAEEALTTLQHSGQDLPFIITSGAVSAEDVVSLLKQGAHDFMDKRALARLVPAIERELREAEMRRSQREAQERVRILSRALEQSPVAVLITNPDACIEYVNPRFEEQSGYSAAEAIGQNVGFTLQDERSDETLAQLWATVRNGQEWHGEFTSRTQKGQLIWEHVTVSPLTDSQEIITHFIVIKEDITIRRSYEEQLLRQAHYDELTGLANRVLLIDRLQLAINNNEREVCQAAVLGIDLDHFKNVNDSLGHSIGDNLLKEAADRLAKCVRGGDTLARMGGDEFIVLLPSLKNPRDAQIVAEKILRQFEQPFVIFGRNYFVTASIGIALYPNDGANPHLLMRNADLAMYQAKEQGRNGYHFFTEDINVQLLERLELESQLRFVVERNELLLHYQPIYDLESVQVVGYEALVRWRRDRDTLTMPGVFIPLAEDIGIIHEIDSWVLRTACRELRDIIQNHGMRLAVNISARQLDVENYAQYVAEQLELNQLQPDQVELEITERVLVEDTDNTQENLQALCEMGIRLSIDDFGTGYSSLGYLQRYPFKTLKIDRSFVSNIAQEGGSGSLIETIITLAHGLNLDVVAEGIEREEEMIFLQSLGCDYAQGFMLDKPMTLRKIQLILAQEEGSKS
ncbi:EAL domain-containing protein [Gilvimarinus agarilyticus]|uniref:putative bifunctional diguanylate cyclase/phosphodiesterase n=1 Tax=unclassified Gilvimarinus TaxID=2642066 RepID=UPI001C09937A|nr:MULTISPECIES: EAL domain-containing protein [unclassified Gilvimarinus]MBU2885527.1 EAL domain-containing protein [Gilvimarinus agarilyticus]MDO6570426.1 EAL domain-containing protein [Gilvimarinus sp. 2_MG-2023]MDO6748392.1 EAL domain-containing protein [Gilvimarinus sp. 1_MG-2023]